MNPETAFAQALAAPRDEKEKIASVVQQMSIEELESFLRADVEHVTRRREWREAGTPEMLGHEKTAAKKEKTHDPGWVDAQRGMYRAMRADSTGGGQFLADSELIGNRFKRGLGGAALGAVAGHALGLRPWAVGRGALLGLIAGGTHADMEHLHKRGIRPKLLGLGGAEFTDEAAKKYLNKQASADLYELADSWGRSLAHSHLEKVAALPPVGALQKGIGGVLSNVARASGTARIAGGAAIGAAGGALAGGEGNRMQGALLGGIAGGAAGHLAPRAIQGLGSMNNGVGQYVRRGVFADGKASRGLYNSMKNTLGGNKAAEKVLASGGTQKAADKARRLAMTPEGAQGPATQIRRIKKTPAGAVPPPAAPPPAAPPAAPAASMGQELSSAAGPV